MVRLSRGLPLFLIAHRSQDRPSAHRPRLRRDFPASSLGLADASLASASRDIDELLAADAARTGRSHIFGPCGDDRQHSGHVQPGGCIGIRRVKCGPGFPLLREAVRAHIDGRRGVAAEFLADFPLARAGYLLTSDLSNLDIVLQQLLVDDPAWSLRRQLKTYYLGDFPAESYADGFLAAAQKYV